MMDRVVFNIDDEYVLHICSTCWKKYHIRKVKEWTDAQCYYEAWSDDGITWFFGSQSSLKPIEESSIHSVVGYLKCLNKDKRYKQLVCMNCCGKNENIFAYDKLSFDTKKEIEIKNDIDSVFRQMCFGRSREYCQGVIDRVFKTNVIYNNCIEDDVAIDEDMIVSALMEIVFKDYEFSAE